jgi:hypothetical protein
LGSSINCSAIRQPLRLTVQFPLNLAKTANDGSGSGLDADTVDGLHAGDASNNVANRLVRTEGNGYISSNYFYTSSNNNGTTAIARIYASQDGYIRYYTPTNFRTNLGLWWSGNDGAGSGLDADLLDGYNAEETAVANSIVKRDGNARIEAKKLYLNGGNYEGQIIFGAVDAWRTGIRQHDDGDAEMRIWAKNAAGRVHIATGYDGQPASIARPTDGFVVNANNVGIGDFSGDDPSQKLHVKGNILMSGGTMRASHSKGHQIGSYNNVGANSGNTSPIYTIGSSYNPSDTSIAGMYGIGYAHNNLWGSGKTTGWGMYVCDAGSYSATLSTSGIWSVGNITAYSDRRVKTNIELIPNALEKVCKLNGYTFDRTDGGNDIDGNPLPVLRQTGVIAQEVLEVLPEAVTGSEEEHYSVAYGNMVGLLIESVKELKAEIDELKKQLEAK